MFVVSLNYVKALSEVDRHLEDHIAYLKRYYERGHFVVSGRKQPRNGGVILARAASREEMERIVSEDPFCIAGVADYEITEFVPVLAAEGMESLLDIG